jgi:hypothetical protein
VSRIPRALALAAAAALVALSTALPTAARADVPIPLVAAPFNAPLCPGQTLADPQDAGPGAVVPDLTLVFGDRLDQYNAGGVVVLYDYAGENRSDGGYPPLCGVRHVAGVGAVSEWMFCTDLFSNVCGSTGANGELLDDVGNPMAPLADLGSRNPKLTDDEEKIIAYLVRHGHAFTVPPANAGGAVVPSGVARADGTSLERLALQELIWCVSDGPTGWAELDKVCNAMIDATEQARILSLVPDAPVVDLSLGTTSTDPLAFGETVVVTLRTNVYEQPIDLTAAGLVGTLTVLSGPAT